MSISPSPFASAPVLSIVIPLFNEEAVIEQTYRRLKSELDRLGETYELVFVEDGSTDRSRLILTALALNDPTVRVVVLSRNFGHEMATTAGLRHTRGQAAVVMDADLQDPPELIASFLAKWREGYQVVYGIRAQRQGESLLKKMTSFVFYRLLRRVTEVPIPADTGDFRLMDRRVLDVYQQFHEDPRFFRGLIGWIGFRQIGIPFVRQSRAGGRSKYRYGRLVRLAFDTITAFSTLPALFITFLAAALAGTSLLFLASILVLWIGGLIVLEGWMWVALGFLVLWNVQFMCLALLGEYVVRTHRYTQRRPLYVLDTLIEHPTSGPNGRTEASVESEVTIVRHPSALAGI
jgi:glycosyltransferase involved in cell wall biosynthesis